MFEYVFYSAVRGAIKRYYLYLINNDKIHYVSKLGNEVCA
jgi:hypothetical protein